jgi:hypothetical protein
MHNSPAIKRDNKTTARYGGNVAVDVRDRGCIGNRGGSRSGVACPGVNRTILPRISTNMMEMQRTGGAVGHGRNVNRKYCGGQKRALNKRGGGNDRYEVGKDLLPVGYWQSDYVDSGQFEELQEHRQQQ